MRIVKYLTFGCASAQCIHLNISHTTSTDIYAFSHFNITSNWMNHMLVSNSPSKTLNFNPPTGIDMTTWIKSNTWDMEEWNKDGQHHFTTASDSFLNRNVLQVTAHKFDGDGSNGNNYNQGKQKVRQEIKVDKKSDNIWKMHFDSYIYFELMLKFDKLFKYNQTHF